MTPGQSAPSAGSRQRLCFCLPLYLTGGAQSVLAEGMWERRSSSVGSLALGRRRPAAQASLPDPQAHMWFCSGPFPFQVVLPLGIVRLGVSHQGPGWSVECGASLRPRTLKPLGGRDPGGHPPHPAQPQPIPQKHLTVPPTHPCGLWFLLKLPGRHAPSFRLPGTRSARGKCGGQGARGAPPTDV